MKKVLVTSLRSDPYKVTRPTRPRLPETHYPNTGTNFLQIYKLHYYVIIGYRTQDKRKI